MDGRRAADQLSKKPGAETPGSPQRRGLAPLELVLALPLLLFLMALMINFGVIGAWKIRTQVNSRYALWRSVHTRTGEFNPAPPFWPDTAALSDGTGDPLPNVDRLWDNVPELTYEVIRGPAISAPLQPTAIIVRPPTEHDGFEMDFGVHSGRAELNRPLPLLPGATPNGRFSFDLTQLLLDNRWQFSSVGLPWNDSRRAGRWYHIEHSDFAGLDSSIANAYQLVLVAQAALQNNPLQADLYPLDSDGEFGDRARRCTVQNGDDVPLAPDFYPRIQNACTLDPRQIQEDILPRLIDRIDELPCTMGERFAELYNSEACCWETACQPGSAAYWVVQHALASSFLSKACGRGNNTRRPCPCPTN